MTTRKIALTDTWQQLTTGSVSLFVQVERGDICLADSATQPDSNAAAHRMKSGAEFSVTPPTVAWVRSAGGSSGIIVS